ncbi:MAG TPA: hypothetical protein VKF14_09155 [Candidatus Dormibacteraeota bacterium]|nr:hypothetical protein [Candidatus Dormibacteraeota bacterium]
MLRESGLRMIADYVDRRFVEDMRGGTKGAGGSQAARIPATLRVTPVG